ncbi:hypothetical protein D3C77_513750 [compost metagenome]
MQIALVHQIPAHVGADPSFEQYVIGQHHCRTPTWLETTIDVLQEGQLLVTGLVGQVIAGRTATAPGGTERRVGQDHINLR